MNLYLIRHTHPDVPSGICYGQTNLDTAATFAEEVQTIKIKLGNVAFTHCFSSPLQRCFKLAQELSGKKLIHTDDRLMELNFGDWEMKPWEEISKTDEAKVWFDDFLHVGCPNGESYVQLQERIQAFMQGFRMVPDDAEVLIVTHAGCIRSLMSLIGGQEPTAIFNQVVDYGDVIKLTYHHSK